MNKIHHAILCKRISELSLHEEVRKRIFEALEYVARFSVYYNITFPEYNSSMILVLGFFYSLIKEDIELSKAMMDIAPLFPQLKSSWLKVWLNDDFHFEEEDVFDALTRVTVLMNNGMLNIPVHIFDLLNSLNTKYETIQHNTKPIGSRSL